MNNFYAIWLDRENAKVFFFSDEKMTRKNLEGRTPDHHTHLHDFSDEKRRELQLFAQVAEQIQEPSQILILGPGVAKHHFQTFLTEHFPALAKKIAACEAMDHPTDGEIAAQARKFFHVPSYAVAR